MEAVLKPWMLPLSGHGINYKFDWLQGFGICMSLLLGVVVDEDVQNIETLTDFWGE